MTKVQFSLDGKKYTLEFLPDCQAKITRLDDESKFITVRYLSSTKVMDFMGYVRSLDFSKLKGKNCCIPQAEKGGIIGGTSMVEEKEI